jgi:hypothetical protein
MLITALYVCMYVCICDYVNICMSCAAMYIAPQSLGLLLHKNRIQIKFSYLIHKDKGHTKHADAISSKHKNN